MAQQIGNPYIIVVPTVTNEICTRNEKEIFDDSVKVLNELADIAEPYGVKLSFEPIGDKKWCVNSVRQALEIVNAVNRDSVGLTVDCINVTCMTSARTLISSAKFPRRSCSYSTSTTARTCRSASSTTATA